MLAPMSPAQRGYAAERLDGAEDLESSSNDNTGDSSNGITGESQSDQVEDQQNPKRLGLANRADSRFMHPDDSLHQHWYETTVRLRGLFYIFFSLAVVMALSLGATTETFFFIMAMPQDEGLSYGVVGGILVTPVFLVFTAVYVDECVDMGLDAADKPSFGLFRAAVTASARRWSGKVQTSHVERTLVLLLELLPILVAILEFAWSPAKVYWYKDVGRGYCLGGLVFAIGVCVTYIICHIHVGHVPARDELMAELYHNMALLGRYKRAAGELHQGLADNPSHYGRACLYFVLGMCIEVLVIVLFLFFHKLYAICLGELLAAAFFALALRNFAPRLLGKAFWCTLAFFIVLAGSLLLGTMQSAEGHPSTLEPLVFGPGSNGFNASTAYLGDLPLHFEASELRASSPRSAICRTRWGPEKTGEMGNAYGDGGLSILDLSILAFASSFGDAEDVRVGLGEMLNGTFEDWQLLEVEDWKTTGRWVVLSIPSRKVRVISVRGTSSLRDAYANLQIYASIVVLQFMGILTPVLTLMPQSVIQLVASGGLTKALHQSFRVESALRASAEKHRLNAQRAGEVLLMTGHSLGGALVGAVSTQLSVEGIGFSPPGLLFQKYQWDLDIGKLTTGFTIVQPTNDVVPQVDQQRGLIEWLPCHESALTCHRLTHTACLLWAQCGDMRSRDWRPTCSEWLTKADLNLPKA